MIQYNKRYDHMWPLGNTFSKQVGGHKYLLYYYSFVGIVNIASLYSCFSKSRVNYSNGNIQLHNHSLWTIYDGIYKLFSILIGKKLLK